MSVNFDKINVSGFDYVQNTRPTAPEEGETWLDTSDNPPRALVYADISGTPDWVATDKQISKEYLSLVDRITEVLNRFNNRVDDVQADQINGIFQASFDGFATGYADLQELSFPDEPPFQVQNESRDVDNNRITQESAVSPVATRFALSTNERVGNMFKSLDVNNIEGLATPSDGTALLSTGSNDVQVNSLDSSGEVSQDYAIRWDGNDTNTEIAQSQRLNHDVEFAEWAEGGDAVIIGEYKYTLSTPYSLYASDVVGAEHIGDDSPGRASTFSPDGETFYTVHDSYANRRAYIAQYALESPYNLNQKTETARFYVFNEGGEPGGEDTRPKGLAWNDDGTSLHVLFSRQNKIVEYHCTEPYDISTASYPGSLDLFKEEKRSGDSVYGVRSEFRDGTFEKGGMKYYIADKEQRSLLQFGLTEAYNLETATLESTHNTNNQLNDPTAIRWDEDGSRMFVVDRNGNDIYEYHAKTNYDLGDLKFEKQQDLNNATNNNLSNPTGFDWVEGGEKLIVNAGNIYQIKAETPYDISSFNYVGNDDGRFTSLNIGQGGPVGLSVTDDLKYLYVAQDGSNNNYRHYDVYQWEFGVPGDVTTLRFVGSRQTLHKWYRNNSDNYGHGYARGISVRPDGSEIFVTDDPREPNDRGAFHPRVERFRLEESHDITTLVRDEYELKPFRYQDQRNNIAFEDISWAPDGSHLYVSDRNRDAVYSFDTESAYSLSGTDESCNFISRNASDPYAFLVDPTGDVAWVLNNNRAKAYKYYDYSMASAKAEREIHNNGIYAQTRGMSISQNDEHILVADDNDGFVYQHDVREAGDYNTANFEGVEYVSPFVTNTSDIEWGDDGRVLYLISNQYAVVQFEASTPYDPHTLRYVTSFRPRRNNYNDYSYSSYPDLKQVRVEDGGEQMALDSNNWTRHYRLEAPYDLSQVYRTDNIGHNGSGDEAAGYAYNNKWVTEGFASNINGGDDAIVVDGGDTYIKETDRGFAAFNMETPYSTRTISSIETHVSDLFDQNIDGWEFVAGGRLLWVIDASNSEVVPYYLPEPYDLTTVRDYGSKLSLDYNPYAVDFSGDGSAMVTVDGNNSTLKQYNTTQDYHPEGATFAYENSYRGVSSDVRGLVWGDAGDSLYLIDRSDNEVAQLTASTPYDLASVETYGIDARAYGDRNPKAVAFDDTGESAYISYDGQRIVQYNVSEPFTTMVEDVEAAIDVSSNVGTVDGLIWSQDGTQLYVVDGNNNDFHTFTVDKPYQIGWVEYDSVAFNLQSGGIRGAVFSGSGERVHTADSSNDRVYQHELSAAYDPSTQSFSNGDYLELDNLVDGFDDSMHGIEWSENGNYLHALSRNSTTINTYKTVRPYDALGVEESLDVGNEDGSARGVDLVNGGSDLFISGEGSNSIYHYTLSTPYDLSTASLSESFDSSSFTNQPTGVVVADGGSLLIVADRGNNEIYGFDLSTPYDLSTVGTANTFNAGYSTWGIAISDGGSRLYVGDRDSNNVREYTFGTAYDVSTLTAGKTADVGGQLGDLRGVFVSEDGSRLFVNNNSNNQVNQYDFGANYDLDTISYVDNVDLNNKFNSLSAIVGSAEAVYALDSGNNRVVYYGTKIENDLTTAKQVSDLPTEIDAPTGMIFADSGGQMYFPNDGREVTFRLDTQSSYQTTNLTREGVVGTIDLSAENINDGRGIAFNDDGSVLAVVDNNNGRVDAYSLSTPYDISTASPTTDELDFSSDFGNAEDIAFGDSGSYLYILSNGDNSIHRYDLGTQYDITSQVGSSTSRSINANDLANEGGPSGLYVTDSGDEAFVAGTGYGAVHYFELAQSYDVTDITYYQVRNTGGVQSGNLKGLTVNDDGTKFYFARNGGSNDSNDRIVERTLSNQYQVQSSNRTYTWTDYAYTNGDPIGNIQEIEWVNGGDELLVTDSTVYRLKATTPYDLSTLDYPQFDFNNGNLQYNFGNPYDFKWLDGGSKFFVMGNTYIYEMEAGTPYDINTLSHTGNRYDLNNQFNNPRTFEVNSDGTRLLVASEDTSAHDFHLFELSNPYSLSSVSRINIDNSGGYSRPELGSVSHMEFADGFTRLYLVDTDDEKGNEARTVFEYSLEAPFEIDTAILEDRHTIQDLVSRSDNGAAPFESVQYMTWGDGGTSFYAGDGDIIIQLNLGTAYDLTDVAEVKHRASERGHAAQLGPDEDNLYRLHRGSNHIERLEFGTAGDVSTMERGLSMGVPGTFYSIHPTEQAYLTTGGTSLYESGYFRGDYAVPGADSYIEDYDRVNDVTMDVEYVSNGDYYFDGYRLFKTRFSYRTNGSVQLQRIYGNEPASDFVVNEADGVAYSWNGNNPPYLQEYSFDFNGSTVEVAYNGRRQLNERIHPNEFTGIEYDPSRQYVQLTTNARDAVIQFDVGTPNPIQYVTLANRVKMDKNYVSNPRGAEWVKGGTELQVIDSNSRIHKFDAAEAYRLPSIDLERFDNNRTGRNSEQISLRHDVTEPIEGIRSNYQPRAFTWADGGTTLVVSDTGRNRLYVYRSTNYELGNIEYVREIRKIPNLDDTPYAIAYHPDGLSLYAGRNQYIAQATDPNADRRGLRIQKTVSVNQDPETVIVVHTAGDDIEASYTLEDSNGNSVTVQDADVGTVVDVSLLDPGEITVTQTLDAVTTDTTDVMENFGVYFN